MFQGLVRCFRCSATSPFSRAKRAAAFFAGATLLGLAWQVIVAGLLGQLFPGEASAGMGVLGAAILNRDLLYIAGIVVAAPVVEEFIFRYGLFALLSFPRFGVWPTSVMSALPFGLLHLYSGPLSAAFATVTGIIFGYVYAVTRDIWCAIGTHSGVNLAAMGIVAFGLFDAA